MSQPPAESKKNNGQKADKVKQFSEFLKFSAGSNVKEVQRANNDHCPLADVKKIGIVLCSRK